MWQVDEAKVTTLTRGGLTGKQVLVVTTNGEKSAEVIVLTTSREGPNGSSL